MRSLAIVLLSAATAFAGAQARGGGVSADELLRRGVAAQQQRDVKTAIEEYRKALALEPGSIEARANLGAALAASGDFDAAIAEDKRALTAMPENAALRKNLALAYYKKGDWAHARPELEAVHKARPSDISTTVLLGYTDLKLGNAAGAAALLIPLEHGHETDMDFEFVLGSALLATGKESEGLPRLEEVARSTKSADAYVIAGSTRLHRREFREAKADLQAAIELQPGIAGVSTMAGQACDALGETDEAARNFQAALQQDPQDFMANLTLGAIRLKARDLDGARPLLELALHLQPNAPQARLQMAKLNAMTGHNEDAAAAFEQLEKADPSWLDPHVELAPLYYKLHRPEDGERERKIVEQIEAHQQQAGPPK